MPRCYIPGYPRPQFVRRQYELLDGEWSFAFDPERIGRKQGWHRGIPQERTIIVPYTYEATQSGIGDCGHCSSVWYMRKCSFSVATEQNVRLIFEGVDYETVVWVNGEFVGAHTGAYARFEMDITRVLRSGEEAMIVVQVLDHKSAEQPRGKQRWLDENYTCWYTQTTGIWKTVWAEYVHETHVKTAKITPDYDESQIKIEFEINGVEPDEHQDLWMETNVHFKDTLIYSGRDRILALGMEKYVILKNSNFKWEVETWTPEHPNLYDIEYCLYRDGELVDRVESYFGVRKISCENGRFCINYQDVYLHMVLDQGYWPDTLLTPPDEDSLVFDLKQTLAFGFNGVRKHQKIEDERFYYWADVLGVLVWCECPSVYKFSGRSVEALTTEWMEILQQNYNHPSIVTWVAFNESWGIPKVYANPSHQAFAKALFYLTKTLDPSRVVIGNDGWEHTKTDILGLHDYAETGAILQKHYQDMNAILENRLAHNGTRFAFSSGQAYQGQPIMLTEFGGIAYSDAGGWGYGQTAETEEAFLERFTQLVKAAKKIPSLAGYCYTQLTDVQQEINGLMTMQRTCKIAPDRIREILLSGE